MITSWTVEGFERNDKPVSKVKYLEVYFGRMKATPEKPPGRGSSDDKNQTFYFSISNTEHFMCPIYCKWAKVVIVLANLY